MREMEKLKNTFIKREFFLILIFHSMFRIKSENYSQCIYLHLNNQVPVDFLDLI